MSMKPLLWDDAGSSELLSSGHKINDAELLFDKIEDVDVEKQVSKLRASEEANKNQDTNMTELIPERPEISYDDFIKLDMRIGEILEAESVPKSKKLLKLKIDTGLDKRTIVSGIAKDYTPEDIIGSKVCVLVNLAPRKIMGIDSQGMVLMGENQEGRLAFLLPDKDINTGSQIS